CAATDICGHNASLWNTIPTFRLCGGRKVLLGECTKAWLPTWIEPWSGVSKPAKHLRVVVLPHPLGPSSVMNSPLSIDRLTSFRMWLPLKDLLSELISMCMPNPFVQ